MDNIFSNHPSLEQAFQHHVGAHASYLFSRIRGVGVAQSLPRLTCAVKQGPRMDVEAALLLERTRRICPELVVQDDALIGVYRWKQGERILAVFGFAAGAALLALWTLALPEALGAVVLMGQDRGSSRVLVSPWALQDLLHDLAVITDPRDLGGVNQTLVHASTATPAEVIQLAIRLLVL